MLAPLRLLDILAIGALALGSTGFRRLAESPALRALVICGRNSLEVFSLGTVLAMICRLAFRTFGVTTETELLANGIGIGLMVALAAWLEQMRRPAAAKNFRRSSLAATERLASPTRV